MPRAELTFDAGELRRGLDDLDDGMRRFITAATDRQATEAEAVMKTGAPWTDRTGNARAGLYTLTSHGRREHEITLAHSVSYGIWLEVRWNGRYEIIMPTARSQAAALMRVLARAFTAVR